MNWKDINKRNLERIDEGGKLYYMQAVKLVLIGPGHADPDVERVRDSFNRAEGGLVKIENGTRWDFLADGVRDRREFEDAIQECGGRYKKSKVTYLN